MNSELNLTIQITISNPTNYSERLEFRDTKELPNRSFTEISKIFSAFNTLFTELK